MTQTKTPQDWFEPGLRFECTQCGNCCTGPPGFVWFDEAERDAIAAYLDVSVERFLRLFARRLNNRWTLQEVKRDGRYDCVFLDRDERGRALCSIYGVRPTQCRTWPFWPENLGSEEQWRAAARDCPGMVLPDSQAGDSQADDSDHRARGDFVPADQVRLVRDSNPPE